jgi:hypothetical protein
VARSLVIADASTIINLEASQAAAEIVDACELELGVVDPHVWGEVLFVYRAGEPEPIREAVDLDLHEAEGRIRRIWVAPSEVALHVRFASRMDDGEAACLAVAVARGLPLAGDDRALARVIGDEALVVQRVTTPELLRSWAAATAAGADRVSNLLRNVEVFGHYRPPASDPLFPWWIAAR